MTEQFTKEQFEAALPKAKIDGTPLWEHWRFDMEEVYLIPINGTDKRIIVRSTVGEDGLAKKDTGTEFIRAWVEFQFNDSWYPVGGKANSYTERSTGWEGRLTKKLRQLWKAAVADERDGAEILAEQVAASEAAEGFNQAIDEQLAKPLGMVRLTEELNAETIGAQAKEALRQFDHKARPKKPKSPKLECPDCGKRMRKRSGKYGDFYGCSGFPNCRRTMSLKDAEILKPGPNIEKCINPNDHEPGTACVYCGVIEPREFSASPFQEKIFAFVETGTGNGMVEAVAGSGKTTTIIKALELTTGTVLFCAFNKHIQQELARRAPGHVQVSTVHSIGFRALCTALPHKPGVDNGKLWGICKELLPESDQYPLRQPLSKLVSLCKKTLTDFTDPVVVEEMADYYGVELNGDAETLIALVPKAMALSAERLGVIDFDDMLWLPLHLNVHIPKFDWVFVDEAQDLSKSQAEIVKRSLKDGGRILLVGDRKQSIYGFTGADCQSIPRLAEEFETQALPLSITYRCPKSVVELAQRIVPQIEAADWAEDGEIRNLGSFNWMSEVKDRDLVLCRVNAPLVTACYSFIRRGTKAVIRGRDIGKGLLNFIDKLAPMDVQDLLVKIREYRYEETAKLSAAGKEERIGAIEDRCDTLMALCDGVNDLTELRYNIKAIFDDDEKDGIILSSVHRAKGDEAETVYLLHPELLPHPLATKAWQREQESNLEYVAYTRAKRTLVFVN